MKTCETHSSIVFSHGFDCPCCVRDRNIQLLQQENVELKKRLAEHEPKPGLESKPKVRCILVSNRFQKFFFVHARIFNPALCDEAYFDTFNHETEAEALAEGRDWAAKLGWEVVEVQA